MSKKNRRTHILMTGGGTLGPVMPLMAIVDDWKWRDQNLQVSWIGTPNGPERTFIEARNEAFYILSTPKISRHQPWKWPFVPVHFLISVVRAYFMLTHKKPDIMFSAGGYVSVPVSVAAKFLRIPHWIHQLDVRPGLANRMMAFFSEQITTTWESSAEVFSESKTKVIGGMVRKETGIGKAERFIEKYNLRRNIPTILVMGGGTGSVILNDAMEVIGQKMVEEMNIIHLVGKGKMTRDLEKMPNGYVAVEFLAEDMADAYALADVVVARAGMGTIMALVKNAKPTILVPIQGSHQEDNAHALEEKGAAVVLNEITPQLLKQAINRLLADCEKRRVLEENISDIMSLNADGEIVKAAIARLEGK